MQDRNAANGRIILLAAALALTAPMAPVAAASLNTGAASPSPSQKADSQQAREQSIPEPFRGDTPGSPIRIDYHDWSAILHDTVVAGGRSTRSFAPTEVPQIGTRLTIGDRNSFRNEGNRIDFKEFKGKNLEVVSHIRHELEQLPGVAPLATWSKTAQLAYWLNLYNITVVEQIAKDYPIRRLKKLRHGRHSLWDKKLLAVSGVKLSLNDIRHILVTKWDTTLVMYGLFQGYVGSPNIPTEAYTAANVHHLLLKNAREFVNSNRGAMLRGSTLKVSEFYKENADLFPDFDKDLRTHLMHLVDPGMRGEIKAARRIKATTHDYYIADVYGGGMLPQSGTNTNSAALMSAMVTVKAGPSGAASNQSFETYSGGNNYKNAPIEMRFPPAAMHYIQKIKKDKSLRPGHVTLEEIDSSAKSRVQGAPAETPADTPAKSKDSDPK